MHYAILADIHANLEALTAVLADINRGGGAGEFWVLGDIVNYGPDPGKCIDKLLELPLTAVSGNHDLAAIGKLSAEFFNADAAAALGWTAGQLTAGDIEFLGSLPETVERGGFTLVHGSPRAPAVEYLMTIAAARQNFGLLATRHALTGHTHQPAAFKLEDSGNVRYLPLSGGIELSLSDGRYIINPGSVGQPRDGDPRASYAVYDSEAAVIRLHRVDYDIKATQAKMAAAGLPSNLIARLETGR
jgi:diadenosine tetraphosphatase ApaH/serine/threonine PP2A family protein phosphatase